MKLSARGILMAIWGGLCLMALAAPLLVRVWPAAGLCAHFMFRSPVCHQLPERSFMLPPYDECVKMTGFVCPRQPGHSFTLDRQLAVCHRCSGIYLGLLLGTLLAPRLRLSMSRWRIAILTAALPLTLDALLSYTGLWIGTPSIRFLTGLIFGGMAGALLVKALAELIDNPGRAFNPRTLPLETSRG